MGNHSDSNELDTSLIWVFTVQMCSEDGLLIFGNSNFIVSICMGKSLRFKRVGYVINMGFHCSNVLGGWFTHIQLQITLITLSHLHPEKN